MDERDASLRMAFEQDWNIVGSTNRQGAQEAVQEADTLPCVGSRDPIIHHLLPNVRLKLESQRLQARLTLSELSDRISVQQERIRLFEAGDVMPDMEEMTRIEMALQVKLSPVCDAVLVG